jgi:hypothetical protein
MQLLPSLHFILMVLADDLSFVSAGEGETGGCG